MGLMPWRGSCALVLTVTESLVSHDMACPQVSPSLPRTPSPGFLPPQSAVAVPWCPVTGSEGRGPLRSVAVILALDERPGQAKGALWALLTGVPKPRVAVSCSLGH